jgi:hypothetical protein
VSHFRQFVLLILGVAAASCGCDSTPTGQPKSAPAPATLNETAGLSSAAAFAGDAAPASPPRSDDCFEDVTGETRILFAHHNGREGGRFYFIESFGGGAAMVDFDQDGAVDLFFTGGGTISADSPVRIAGLPSGLFRNLGDWAFADVALAAGFAEAPDYSQGCAISDIDADGFPDLLVCCYGRSRLYRNQGDGTFANDRGQAGLPSQDWHTTAAFGDIDRDGLPDLFLARYTDWRPAGDVECYGSTERIRDLCGPASYPGKTCQFFHNVGEGRFEDWSERVGLKENVHGLGVVAGDFDGDGWIDFYVASDETPKQLYLGTPELQFAERAAAAGVAVGELGQNEGSMGVAVGDYNGDGLPDIFVTNFENEDGALYRNLGNGLFLHATVAAGLSGRSRRRVGFGTALADFDGDGWLDLFVLNGNPIYRTAETPYKQQPQLFRNIEGRRFENITDRGGTYFHEAHSGRGNAVGDLNGDGAPDLVTVLMDEPARILRNRQPPQNHVCVDIRARWGERDGTGAVVSLDAEGRRLVRFAVRGEGFFSQSDSRMIFPLPGGVSRADVTVQWPGRATEIFHALTPGKTHVLVEGRGEDTHAYH